MYEQYWKLKEKPFENTPDPRFMYYSKKHEEALMRLLYAIKEEKGAAMLSGDYGSGKTVLSRIVINELIKDKTYEVALITHPQLTPVEFIEEIIYQLKNEHYKDTKPKLLHILQDIIYKNYNEGKKTIILIDEAQIIEDKATLEELRLLLNFQLNSKFLITLVLIGQPELLEMINSIPQLQQRLGIKYHLTGLDGDETEQYIKHRLAVARQTTTNLFTRMMASPTETIFTKESIDLIYDYSEGLPRKINNVCDMSLLIGFGQEVDVIDKELTEKVIADLNVGVINHAENV